MTSLRDPLPIAPLRTPFDLAITPPGSKSLTCRAYVLAALSQGTRLITDDNQLLAYGFDRFSRATQPGREWSHRLTLVNARIIGRYQASDRE